MIAHHPPRELLLDYAAGAVSEGVSLVVASHLSICATCAAQADALEGVGGLLLIDECMAEIDEDALQRTLALLDEPAPSTATPIPLDAATRAIIPPPLRRYLAADLDGLPWRSVGGRFDEVCLPLAAPGPRTTLMRLRPGGLVPKHGHRGNEVSMVLAGGYTDAGVSFRRGDFSTKDVCDMHQPRADDDEGCLCLLVLAAPVRPTGIFARLLTPFQRT